MSLINIIGKTIKTIKSISGSDDTLNITDTDGSAESIIINNVKNAVSATSSTTAMTATKASQDALGNTISDTYAPLASPTFTGIPAAPTAASNTNTTQLATTAFVANALASFTGNGSGAVSYTTSAANPNFYNRDELFMTAKTTITTPSILMVNINNAGYILQSAEMINLSLTSSWDSDSSTYTTAANRAGRDFYIYACVPTSGTVPTIVLSANSTVPTGYTATNSRKIGGFHCLCADVGTISGHPLSGYIAGDILPASAWDLLHRAESSNEGMVYDKNTDMWVDIYLNSYTGTTAAKTIRLHSTFGGVIADGASTEKFHWFKGVDVLMLDQKTLPTQREFMSLAKGSNEGTNIAGSADPNTTGGHTDTAGRRMISNIGCEDCCGVLWQWGIEGGGGNTGGAYQNAFDANDFSDVRGQQYQEPCRSFFGAGWAHAGVSGSRASNWGDSPLTLNATYALRGVSRSRKVIL